MQSNSVNGQLDISNIIVITDERQVIVPQAVTNVIEVNNPGPQGPTGPSAPFTNVGGGIWATTSSIQITGSLSITGSGFYVNGNRQFNYGAFSSTQTQTLAAVTSGSMTFNTIDVIDGITLSNNSRLVVPNAGIYNIQFSSQLNFYAGADDVYIWLKKNGSNVSNSATVVSLQNNSKAVAAWNWVYPLNANDYVEIAWQTAQAHARLLANTSPSGNVPAIPSVIVTVTQVA